MVHIDDIQINMSQDKYDKLSKSDSAFIRVITDYILNDKYNQDILDLMNQIEDATGFDAYNNSDWVYNCIDIENTYIVHKSENKELTVRVDIAFDLDKYIETYEQSIDSLMEEYGDKAVENVELEDFSDITESIDLIAHSKSLYYNSNSIKDDELSEEDIER